MLSHRSTAFNAEALSRRNRGFEPGAKTLAVLPLSHGYGVLMMNTWSIWGASIHVLPQWDVAAAFEAIQQHRIQHLSLVPTMFSDMVSFPDRERFDTSSLETSGSGGAFLPDDLRLEFERTFGVMVRDGYGMTEYCSVVCCYDFEDDPHRPGSVGTPIADTEVRIVDFNGNDVPPGVDGELLVRGPCTMTGYWNKEEATRATVRDGWVHSGDVAHLDEDGYIYITGRTKDLIIKGGENISPKELEEAIQEHPAVAVVAVVGVPHERYGEDICAVVLPVPNAEVTEEEIKRHAAGYVTKFKVPSRVVFLDEMPTTHSGKVQKNKLREIAAGQLVD
jgi:long-chain acyl-CoA synthetase